MFGGLVLLDWSSNQFYKAKYFSLLDYVTQAFDFVDLNWSIALIACQLWKILAQNKQHKIFHLAYVQANSLSAIQSPVNNSTHLDISSW